MDSDIAPSDCEFVSIAFVLYREDIMKLSHVFLAFVVVLVLLGVYLKFSEEQRKIDHCLVNGGEVKWIDGYFNDIQACYIGEYACSLYDYHQGSCVIPSDEASHTFKYWREV